MRFFGSLVVALGLLWTGGVSAQDNPVESAASNTSGRTLSVGVKVAPPFVIGRDGGYGGLAIELWEEAASEHGWKYTFQEYDLEGLLGAVRAGHVDIGIGAITATAAREETMDFAHPITSSGLGVAVRSDGGSGWLAVVQALVSPAFLKVIGLLVLLLFAVGVLVWALERRHNPEQFGGGRRSGIFSGFWWAMVTMTTVGYGDLAPRSVGGRILGMVWMLTALIVVSFFTASITSALTVGKLQSEIRSPSDLANLRIASIAGSTSGSWLDRNDAAFVKAESLDTALADLAAERVDAVVYDIPLLAWKIRQRYKDNLHVLSFTLERQDYAFALPTRSPLREQIDTSILKRINSPDWNRRLERYFGEAK